ncbi:DUF397 domain-containing protein [Nocardia tengchongensis]|uniref:DUF397 domain-containing protein n=1 Tax=Nocardia tengchongensis TaxID=2055889 RepID=A0ABX8CM52_9NOCA|nr:DUF397 domain-containing protein [Nocardia tengchongensis]QVI21017.1 DUF397 domain-containing protein [Nocardia tengchongensis]
MTTKADLPAGLQMRTSTAGGVHGSCVQVGYWPGRGIVVAHSKEGGNGAVLLFTVREWESFIEGVKADEFPAAV